MSEPVAGAQHPREHSCVVLGARSQEIRKRIETALGSAGEVSQLVFLDDAEASAQLALAAPEILILVCELAGAAAIVFEPLIESTLAVTVSAVGSGQAVVPRELRASVERPALSHRERQVLTHVCEGLTNSQIAEQLFLSESTVKSHLSSAFAKFGVRSRREAAALFIELDQSIPSASEVTT